MFEYLYKVMFYPVGSDGPGIGFTSKNPNAVYRYIVETLEIENRVAKLIIRGDLQMEHEGVYSKADSHIAIGTKCRIVCKN